MKQDETDKYRASPNVINRYKDPSMNYWKDLSGNSFIFFSNSSNVFCLFFERLLSYSVRFYRIS